MTASDDRLVELRSNITRVVRESTGLHEQAALLVAEEILQEMRAEWGGSEVYIPAIGKKARRLKVMADFNGRNHAAVCAKHDISIRTLYNYLKE